MSSEEALTYLYRFFKAESLSHVQELVFCGAWEERVYEEMGASSGYDADYLRDVGSKLWRSLSERVGEKVTKSNFRSVLKRHAGGGELWSEKVWQAGVGTQWQPGKVAERSHPIESSSAFHQNCDETTDVTAFFGRHAELSALQQWMLQDKCRLIALLGMGGIGKTALAAKLAEQIQEGFECALWQSLHDAPPVAEMLAEMIQCLSNNQQADLPTALEERIRRLVYYLRSRRCLLVLDNFERVFQGGIESGLYREGYEGYGELLRIAAEARHQSCLVLTSREKPRGWEVKASKTLPVRSMLLSGLHQGEARLILAEAELCGSEWELDELIERYAGNPLALKVAATAIQELFNGCVGKFLEQGTLVFGGLGELLAQQFNRLSELEKQVMEGLAASEDGATLDRLQEEIFPAAPQPMLLEALQSLLGRSLIQRTGCRFIQQPFVREYVRALRGVKIASVAAKPVPAGVVRF